MIAELSNNQEMLSSTENSPVRKRLNASDMPDDIKSLNMSEIYSNNDMKLNITTNLMNRRNRTKNFNDSKSVR
jgi:GH24 family phage-related lysozyme (muramidase)